MDSLAVSHIEGEGSATHMLLPSSMGEITGQDGLFGPELCHLGLGGDVGKVKLFLLPSSTCPKSDSYFFSPWCIGASYWTPGLPESGDHLS